jgi:hypothetical protein
MPARRQALQRNDVVAAGAEVAGVMALLAHFLAAQQLFLDLGPAGR